MNSLQKPAFLQAAGLVLNPAAKKLKKIVLLSDIAVFLLLILKFRQTVFVLWQKEML